MGLLDDRLKLNKDMTQLRGSIECEEGKKSLLSHWAVNDCISNIDRILINDQTIVAQVKQHHDSNHS